MTDKNLTEIVCVMDKSGSMFALRDDTIGGFNNYIAEQKKLPGNAKVTLIQFNHEYKIEYNGLDIASVQDLTRESYVPGGNTSLYDAVGFAVNTVGARLASVDEDKRPSQVIVLVITDGQENSSKEFKGDKVKSMVSHQIEKYNWKFVYLGGGDLDTHKNQGLNLGFSANNIYNYTTDSDHTKGVYQAISNGTTRARRQALSNQQVAASAAFFDKDELNLLNNALDNANVTSKV